MNIIELIKSGSDILKKNNISSHHLDSEIILSKVLNETRENILINSKKKIILEKEKEFKKLIFRRSHKEPIAHIFNEKEFWSKVFYVDKSTLVPRPETELLVEQLVDLFRDKSLNILDIGTGSGCILISLLSELKNSKGLGVDISNNAIKVAIKNSIKYKVNTRSNFLRLPFSEIFNKKFDLVVSNPPYIKSQELNSLEVDIRNYEPKLALDGGNDGLDLIKKVIYKAKNILKIKGMLALEIGNGQFKKVSRILIRNNFRVEKFVKDYNENVRCILSKLIY